VNDQFNVLPLHEKSRWNKAEDYENIGDQTFMLQKSFVVLLCLFCLCGCKTIKSIQSSSKAIADNRTAIEKSTGVINDNAKAIADSSLIIQKNEAVIEQSTAAVEKNAQALDKVAVAMDKLKADKPAGVFIIVLVLALLTAPSLLALLVLLKK